MASIAIATRLERLPALVSSSNISLAEIISALSFALDLTEGAMPGHALRTCVLGMRLGEAQFLPPARMSNLYYALLLKDVGCNNNFDHLSEILGDGKDSSRFADNAKNSNQSGQTGLSMFTLLWNTGRRQENPLRRAAGLLQLGFADRRKSEAIISLRCDRGARILRKLGLGDGIAESVRGVDEKWDGSGFPGHRTRHHIPLESRMVSVAQFLDVYAFEHGPEAAIRVLCERSERWFDPKIVRLTVELHRQGKLWRYASHATPEIETRAAVLDFAPDGVDQLKAGDIDLICEAFSDVVDAKSSFTFRHSLGVTQVAIEMARVLGLTKDRTRLVHRAALLHDLGKLRVPNSILDKKQALSAEEWAVVREHPTLTREILSRIGPFAELARIAGAHHEKLDGSGYPNGLKAPDLPIEARIITVADMYGAMTEDRPYRPGMTPEQALYNISREVPHRLDAQCFEALETIVASA
ncbi:MAG: HD-GYP domain-containing protein [Terracidiphilus sp.]